MFILKVESVDLALNILDGSTLKGCTIGVERAKFTLKGAYDPTKKPRKRKKKDIEKLRKKQEKYVAPYRFHVSHMLKATISFFLGCLIGALTNCAVSVGNTSASLCLRDFLSLKNSTPTLL